MVESEYWQAAGFKPPDAPGVGIGLYRVGFQVDQRKIGHADHPAAGVAPGSPKSVELLDENILYAGFFFQFPKRRRLQPFIHIDKTARQRPLPFERSMSALNEQYFEFMAFIQSKDHAVNSESRPGIFVGVWHVFSNRFLMVFIIT